ncbi:MAG TPA: metalloregulator ArsR/SmtB family transcription factor [Devosiaceae bacterium]|nr:metalloregulator ArsR/SmtB family transcription factor [Devosiaceae bacterium]
MDRDSVFQALADANRRAILDRLATRNGQTLSALTGVLDISRQAVTKHLKVLEEAGLVIAVRKGRERLHYLNPVPIHTEAIRWLTRFERTPIKALAALAEVDGREDDR